MVTEQSVTKMKVKVLIWYNPRPLPCWYSAVFYNLTTSRELTQPWCESSAWGDSDQPCSLHLKQGLAQMISYPMFCWYSFYLPREGWKVESTPSQVEWVLNLGPVTWQSAVLPTELIWLDKIYMKACVELRLWVQKEFKDIFTDIGCFKGTFLLQVKEGSKPYQAPLRHVAIFIAKTNLKIN